MVERTNADIVRDLLDFVKDQEWVGTHERCARSCCWKYRTRCSSCNVEAGDYGKDGYKTHKSGCRIAALILETETFLQVEEKLANG